MKKICMFLVLCLAAMGVYGHGDVNDITQIDIMAKGLDEDIPGPIGTSTYTADTLIVGKIVFDEVTGVPTGQVEFHLTIYDESGKKVYSMKGHLKNATVISGATFPCSVREVTWINLWFVMGEGRIKTTDVIIENFQYRGSTITLPNTGGKYDTLPIVMVVSPLGEHEDGFWDGGGWAFAGILDQLPGNPKFGGLTYLTKYLELQVP